MNSQTYILGQGAPTILDLLLPVYTINILVNEPGILFERFRLVTSLGINDGVGYEQVKKLGEELHVVAHCGNVGVLEQPVEVVTTEVSTGLEFAVGPMGMYQTRIRIGCRSDRPIDEVVRNLWKRPIDSSFLFGIVPVLTESAQTPGGGHHGGGHHGGGHNHGGGGH